MKHWSIFFRAVSGHACYSQHVLRVHVCGEPHIASAKRRSVETQHCLWNVQCALRKLKNVICEVSFTSDSNEKDETVLEICYANYENLNWICTRLIEWVCMSESICSQTVPSFCLKKQQDNRIIDHKHLLPSAVRTWCTLLCKWLCKKLLLVREIAIILYYINAKAKSTIIDMGLELRMKVRLLAQNWKFIIYSSSCHVVSELYGFLVSAKHKLCFEKHRSPSNIGPYWHWEEK